MQDKPNVRPYNNKQRLLFPSSIGDFLPHGDLAHVVDEAVEQINLKSYYNKISTVGNPSYDPKLMIKIWFYAYCSSVSSSRNIEDKLYKDVAFIYLSGMQKPDFKTISEFRKNNIEELKSTFKEIVKICHKLGMVKLGEISLDATVMKADASAKRSYDKDRIENELKKLGKEMKAYLDKSDKIDEEEDEKYGKDNRGTELPEEIKDRGSRIKKIKEIVKKLEQAKKDLKETGKKKINLTDKDAQFQKDRGNKIPGYRGHAMVDGKEQVIITNEVTNDQADNSQLKPMVDKSLEDISELEKEKAIQKEDKRDAKEAVKLTVDSGYSSGKNLAKFEDKKYKDKVDLYMPDARYQSQKRDKKANEKLKFDGSNFKYSKEGNYFKCYAGKKLHFKRKAIAHDTNYLIYACKDCKGCKNFGKCTKSKNGREIWISEYQKYIKKMRMKLSTDEGKKIYSKRKTTVEPVFGNITYNLGFNKFSIRGLNKVKGEFSLMCIAHNIRKIWLYLKKMNIGLKEALNCPTLLPVRVSS